jgi:hypothetical protein
VLRGATPVRMGVSCGDVCPQESLRVVELMADPSGCDAAGGVIVPAVHFDIHPRCVPTCVPASLAGATLRCDPAPEAGAPLRGVAPDAAAASLLDDRAVTMAPAPGGVTAMPSADASSAEALETLALRYAVDHGTQLGLSDPHRELSFARAARGHDRRPWVVLQQSVQGVPIFGALVVVHFDASGEVSGWSFARPDLSEFPTAAAIDTQEAGRRVSAYFSARYGASSAALPGLSSPQLYVLPARWLQVFAPGQVEPRGARLVWRVPATFASPGGEIRTDAVVDATTGAILAAQYAWMDIDLVGLSGRDGSH